MIVILCEDNRLTFLDCNTLLSFQTLICDNNRLRHLYIKNGHNEINGDVRFANNPDMEYFCVDPTQFYLAQRRIIAYGYANCRYGRDCDSLITDDFKSDTVTVYPNPSDNFVLFTVAPEIALRTVSVFNTLGQLILSFPASGNETTLDSTSLQKGTYFVKLISDSGDLNSKFIRN